jgi:uncharacterized protein YeaO (DUF488 family)
VRSFPNSGGVLCARMLVAGRIPPTRITALWVNSLVQQKTCSGTLAPSRRDEEIMYEKRLLADFDLFQTVSRSSMPITIVRLGSPRMAKEGLRLGTVRRPPRGVPKSEYAERDFYDVWLPNLSPSPALLKEGQAAHDKRSWSVFKRKFRSEMNAPDAGKILDLLAALSHRTDFSLGCYCKDESRCHRSILRQLLAERGANFART